MPIQSDFVERTIAELVAKIERSYFRLDCYRDAHFFRQQGYARDVALAMAWGYWGR